MLENIHWLGHATVKISGEKVIYFDPWKLGKNADKADIILITHDHYDHCVPDDVEKIRTENTVIVTTADCAAKLSGQIKTVEAGDRVAVEGVEIETVPAYNVDKDFHPKAKGGVGYVVTVGGSRIYHSGDTDFIPEMEKIQADVILLPVGGTYTMSAEEAAKAANLMRPKVAVPMHYGTIVGSERDAERFKELCDVPVEILKKE